MTQSKSTGVIIGRFQVQRLQPGQLELMNDIISKHEKVAIVLGDAPTLVTKRNPLDVETRKKMLQLQFPAITILTLSDMSTDEAWSRELDHCIAKNFPNEDITLYGSSDNFIPHYHGSHETLALGPAESRSHTNVQLDITEKLLASPDFRAGIIYASLQQFPKVFATVDVAVVKEKEILLARKENEKEFRFVGGYSDPADKSFEDAARRELREETLLEAGTLQYICSARINDWRYGKEEDKIITHLFMASHIGGSMKPQDDIKELKWFVIDELTDDEIVEEHLPLLHSFQAFYTTKK
jgi:bifunctional NMN adenylyltransferase/nudix hydrolase